MATTVINGMTDSRDPVSDEMKHYFQIVIFVVLGGMVSLFGVGTNIVNIVVFVRQGFKDSINISLLGLAVADLTCVVTMFWISVCCSPLVANSDLPFNAFDVPYMTGGWPHVCFNRITSFITAFITLERCLCITTPLKVKNILTPLKTKIIIISIFIVMLALFSPFYFVNKLEWRFSITLNRTILTLVHTRDKVLVETITFPIHSVFMSITALVSVAVCTVVLVVSLNKKTKWRSTNTTSSISMPESTTMKEQKVVTMVIFISVIFVICYSPATVLFLIMVYDQNFSFTGVYENLFYVIWALTLVLETLSSSVNIFVYIKMSTKFRTVFLQTFSCCENVVD